MYLHTLVGKTSLPFCQATDSIAHVGERVLTSRSGAVAVLGADQRLRGVLTARRRGLKQTALPRLVPNVGAHVFNQLVGGDPAVAV